MWTASSASSRTNHSLFLCVASYLCYPATSVGKMEDSSIPFYFLIVPRLISNKVRGVILSNLFLRAFHAHHASIGIFAHSKNQVELFTARKWLDSHLKCV